MRIWNDFLDKLDRFFESKSKNEKWMLILMIFIVICYMSYSFFYPYAKGKYEESVSKKEHFQKSIMTHKQYLQSITRNGDKDYYIKEYDKEIMTLEKNINTTNDEINFISSNLEELSPLLFNKESWSKFLNSITHRAKDQHVKIKYIENEYVDNNGSFGHVLQISVGCNGSYKNIVKFMNQLEKNVLVTDIYGSAIKLEDDDTIIGADINISVWGINH